MKNNTAETQAIDRLNLDAWQVRVTDSNRAFELSSEALHRSKKTGYEKGEAEALRTFGFCHVRLAKYADAQALLEQAFQLFLRSGDTRNQAVVHEYFGILLRSQGDYAASLDELFRALTLSRECQFREEEALTLYHLSITYKYLGDLDHALEQALRGLSIAKEIGEKMPESYLLNCIGGIYHEMGRLDEAQDFYRQSLALRHEIGDQWGVAGCLDNLGNLLFQQGNPREALRFCQQSLEITQLTGDLKGRGNTLFNVGKIHAGLGEYEQALSYLRQSLQVREEISDKKGLAETFCFLGALHDDPAFPQSNAAQAFDFLQQALTLAEALNARDITWKIHLQLSKTFKRAGTFEQALHHFETSAALEKEVNNQAIQQRILNLQITHRVAQAQKEAEIFRLKNVELAELVEEVQRQKMQVQQALDHLQTTQNQLIQSEKLASLGELTAGIAHEIQNPLNFVNNFSELSVELAEELKLEIGKLEIENWDGSFVQEILNDLTQNQQKINYHGKRASSIVSGMLQHARTSTGKKELTDLNALADEYLRLSYHGLRAKDSTFNANMFTDFDPSIGKVEVVPQDIGRVFLNLLNNAFYATQQRQRQAGQDFPSFQNLESLGAGQRYEPTVSISSKKTPEGVEFRIRDNGTGIPEAVKAKIFQPFFTTKPTGQGTGLGLSLAYDIVTKGHTGTLEVTSLENEGTEFIIRLPLQPEPFGE